MEEKRLLLVFRNVNNEDIQIAFDRNITNEIKNVKLELLKCINMLNRNDDNENERKSEINGNEDSIKRMKLFFKGRPLKDNEQINELKLSNNDVILYMIASSNQTQMNSSAERNLNNDSTFDTSSIIENVNNSNSNGSTSSNVIITFNRGFNRFLLYGVSPNEIAMIRLFFHSSIYQRSIQHNIHLDWSRESILEREERWLQSQNTFRLNNRYRHPTLRLLRRQNRTVNINLSFLKGFLLGFLLNIFGIIFMLLTRNLSPSFRCGFQFGVLISLCCCLIPYLLK